MMEMNGSENIDVLGISFYSPPTINSTNTDFPFIRPLNMHTRSSIISELFEHLKWI